MNKFLIATGAPAPKMGAHTAMPTVAASTVTSAVSGQCVAIMLTATQNSWVEVNSAPTASSSTHYLPANVPEVFAATPNVTKVAVLQGASAGVVGVTELEAPKLVGSP